MRESARRHPEASAIEDSDGALSYTELLAQVWRTAARLNEHGVRRGDRVVCACPRATVTSTSRSSGSWAPAPPTCRSTPTTPGACRPRLR
ncbi:AMP-binding protein [Oerskovia sp. M15]